MLNEILSVKACKTVSVFYIGKHLRRLYMQLFMQETYLYCVLGFSLTWVLCLSVSVFPLIPTLPALHLS